MSFGGAASLLTQQDPFVYGRDVLVSVDSVVEMEGWRVKPKLPSLVTEWHGLFRLFDKHPEV